MTRSLCAVAAILALLAAAPPTKKPQSSAAAKVGQWTLVTDQMSANLASGAFSAPDHVTMTRADGSVIKADRANGNYKKQQAVLQGNVSVHDTSGTFGLSSAKGTQAQSRGPATLTADQLHVDDKAHLYDANGNVHYEQGDTHVDAASAHLNDASHILTLTGKVHIVQADRTLDAQTATYNTQTGSGEADSNVVMTFPGVTPSIATPKPIKAPVIP